MLRGRQPTHDSCSQLLEGRLVDGDSRAVGPGGAGSGRILAQRTTHRNLPGTRLIHIGGPHRLEPRILSTMFLTPVLLLVLALPQNGVQTLPKPEPTIDA